jgi:cytochrome c-type biogenesis protein CcmE
MSKGVQIAIGAFAVTLLLAGYAATNLREMGSFRYYQTLGEFLAEGQAGDPARVHGYVATGSILRDVEAKQVSFDVVATAPHAGQESSQRLRVRYASLETPDLFKDGAEVVVEGHLIDSGGLFHADNVMAKCPSKFEAQLEAEVASF